MAPLDANKALEYFSFSPWYRTDPPSNNQILRMQNTGMDTSSLNDTEELRKFTGLEFTVVHQIPPMLFIIQKRNRRTPDEADPLETYYVVNNRIQQSPDLYSLLANRLNACIHNITSSMNTLRAQKPAYTPTKGHVWPVSYDPSSAFVSKKALVGSTSASRDTSVAPMDVDGAAAAGNGTQNGEENDSTSHSQIQILGPLARAMQTTGAHTQSVHPAVPPATASSKPNPITEPRIVRQAMTLAAQIFKEQQQEPPEPEMFFPSSSSAGSALGASGLTLDLSDLRMAMGNRRVSTTNTAPGTPRTPRTPMPGTPRTPGPGGEGGELRVKKKKKRVAKDASSATSSSAVPSPMPGPSV